jgi:hypothetical protein
MGEHSEEPVIFLILKYMQKKTPKPKKKNDKYLILLLALMVGIFIIFKNTSDKIINYPNMVYLFAGALVFLVVTYLRFDTIKSEFNEKEKSWEKGGNLIINLLTSAFAGVFIGGILLIPFNYYIIYSSKSNDIEIHDCKIESVFRKSGYKRYTNAGIYFILNDKSHLLNVNNKDIKDIADDKKYMDYILELKTRPGILGTIVIDDWELRHKY